ISVAIISAPTQRTDRSLDDHAIMGRNEIETLRAHLGGGLVADDIPGLLLGHLEPCLRLRSPKAQRCRRGPQHGALTEPAAADSAYGTPLWHRPRPIGATPIP